MKIHPKAFFSYSHTDKELATEIATNLREKGIEVWLDRWEISPGDSLVRKIFEEGLSGADAFLVLITSNSVRSKWVREELDFAIVKRIEGATRLIPLVFGEVDIPNPLQTIRWVNLNKGYEQGVDELVGAIFGIQQKPPLGQPPAFVKNFRRSVGGLSPLATGVGLYFMGSGNHELGSEETISERELAQTLGLTPEAMDDAIEELETYGLIETLNYLGTGPFSYGDITPTYALFLHFRDEIHDFDPERDILTVAASVAANKNVNGEELAKKTGMTPLRLNRAVAYLKDSGLATVYLAIGTAPFDFDWVSATGATRRFVAENS